jgi:hypothetical protein
MHGLGLEGERANRAPSWARTDRDQTFGSGASASMTWRPTRRATARESEGEGASASAEGALAARMAPEWLRCQIGLGASTASAFRPTASAFRPTASAFRPTASAFRPTASAFRPTASKFRRFDDGSSTSSKFRRPRRSGAAGAAGAYSDAAGCLGGAPRRRSFSCAMRSCRSRALRQRRQCTCGEEGAVVSACMREDARMAPVHLDRRDSEP